MFTHPRRGRKFISVRRQLLAFVTVAVLLTLALLPKAVQVMPTAEAISNTVVISQVYGGAGCGTAGCSTYQNDFIELFNRGNSPQSLNGWSVQYAAAAGTAWQVTNLANVTLQPGQYFLVAESFGANGVNPLPTPDTTGTIAMSATAAKVALVNTTTALTGACPTGAQIVDLVGYGATASCFETAVAPAPSTTTADIRAGGGCTETDNNSTDFAAMTPTPRNTATALNVCGGGGTNPSGVGAATPSSVMPGGTTLLTVTVTPGTMPASTGITVTGNLTMIGGSATAAFHDDGLNGDVTAGDNIFSFSA
ncbi:MAG TPA: lamin tail domain-containing protein, partial [Pyrinomonadaceae bacterium]